MWPTGNANGYPSSPPRRSGHPQQDRTQTPSNTTSRPKYASAPDGGPPLHGMPPPQPSSTTSYASAPDGGPPLGGIPPQHLNITATYSSASYGGPPLQGISAQYHSFHQPRHAFHVHGDHLPCFPGCTGFPFQTLDLNHYHLPGQQCYYSCPRQIIKPVIPTPAYAYVPDIPQHHAPPQAQPSRATTNAGFSAQTTPQQLHRTTTIAPSSARAFTSGFIEELSDHESDADTNNEARSGEDEANLATRVFFNNRGGRGRGRGGRGRGRGS